MNQIPTISLRALAQRAPDALSQLQRACEAWGFFRLVDTGIEPEARNRFVTAMTAFFALSADTRRQYLRTEKNPWGYFDQELTKNRQDWKEIYDLGIDQHHPGYESKTPWPDGLPGFKDAMLDWHHQCESISLALLEAIAAIMGIASDALTRHFTSGNTSFLRLNHYPICETPANAAEDYPEEGHLGIHHHTDAGALTVLLQDDVAGLQVRHQDRWVSIGTDRDSLIINVGDMVQVWTNDQFKAPVHRVLANTDHERYSAAFFMNPDFSTDCQPLTGEPRLYRPVNWGEFRSARAAGDYANLGEEVQISHFRLAGL